uniref:Uncharacterized protein n=1 Tax=Timema douglasi TaxID=61478 RepID=A0A7R8VM69_TIMDO|nr:unnamed protein product [Timema douglasi]
MLPPKWVQGTQNIIAALTKEATDQVVPIVLCGNKVDQRSEARLQGLACVDMVAGERLSQDHETMIFFETSSKTGLNIGDTIVTLASTPDRDSNLILPVIGSLVYCKSSALDHAAIEVGGKEQDYIHKGATNVSPGHFTIVHLEQKERSAQNRKLRSLEHRATSKRRKLYSSEPDSDYGSVQAKPDMDSELFTKNKEDFLNGLKVKEGFGNQINLCRDRQHVKLDNKTPSTSNPNGKLLCVRASPTSLLDLEVSSEFASLSLSLSYWHVKGRTEGDEQT